MQGAQSWSDQSRCRHVRRLLPAHGLCERRDATTTGTTGLAEAMLPTGGPPDLFDTGWPLPVAGIDRADRVHFDVAIPSGGLRLNPMREWVLQGTALEDRAPDGIDLIRSKLG